VDDPNEVVIVDPDGSIRTAGPGADLRSPTHPGRYRVVVDIGNLLILRAEERPQRGARVLMAGEIVTGTSLLEVLNMVASVHWRGAMQVITPDAHRVLGIDQGALKYASSNHPDDRLGQVLYRNGILSRSQLDELLAEVTPDRRFGQLVVEKGYIQQEQLFQQLQKQVEHIFFSAILAREGHYVFVQNDESGMAPVQHVHIPIQQLLMEAVQRIDEMALFRERIPHDDLVPESVPRTSAATLDENMQIVLARCDGTRTIEDIARETGLGQFLTVKALYGLLQQNLVVLRPRKSVDVVAVKRLVGQFNEILRDIFMAVATYGGMDRTRNTLEAWIVGSGFSPIFGERIEEDGTLDVDRVARTITEIKAENPMEGLHQALHELVAFALFAATTTLPRDQELALSRDVNSRLRRIRP